MGGNRQDRADPSAGRHTAHSTAFADPSVEFSLQFKGPDAAPAKSRVEQEDKGEAGPRSVPEAPAQEAAEGGGKEEAGDKVVTLDAFRGKK